MLLWLWRRLAATAPIQSLAWELPYVAGAALKRKKKLKLKKILKGRIKKGNDIHVKQHRLISQNRVEQMKTNYKGKRQAMK